MFKKIICALLAFLFVLFSFSGCGKQVVTAKVNKETSKANFAAYKQDIIGIMDKAKVKYEIEDIDISKNPEIKNPDNPVLIFKFTLDTRQKEEIVVAFTNINQIESFTASLDIKRKSLDECKLNISDYSYVRDIFNLVSVIKVSNSSCNSFLKSSRKGMDDKYKARSDIFNISENKYFSRDKTKTWCLQYQISPQVSGKTTLFDESLIYKGILAPRMGG